MTTSFAIVHCRPWNVGAIATAVEPVVCVVVVLVVAAVALTTANPGSVANTVANTVATISLVDVTPTAISVLVTGSWGTTWRGTRAQDRRCQLFRDEHWCR
ncbi:MAG: hypothetical protein BYD32DRAFT_421593 [Podila humilis]|nr:MAG: hypothetical protein BYD32DRAFT_421593 [Podila humilis]